MKRILKVLLALICSAIVIIAVLFAVIWAITKDITLDAGRLTNYSQNITVCDSSGQEIASASLISKRKSVQLEDLSDSTINAFIASEDRTFFTHGGLNYKRMAKALYKNIASRSFKEGASTISQQLVKNTHLSGEKTIKRKLSEIKLTKELEKNYSKDQILEMYLNTIYFGHNCYGIESASEFYFGKTASNLTLEQSAMLAGLLTSPNNFSPFKNPEKCIARRNVVLNCMQECGFINGYQQKTAEESPLSAERQKDSNADGYITAVFDELEDLGLDYYSLSEGCTIKTYLDSELQKYIESIESDCDNSIVIRSVDGGIKAYKSTINGAKRQPGSTIKPLLVYAPAIEEKLLSPSTKILDEKINFGGYSPENYGKSYHGYVTVAESILNSYNIPAVKTLNSLTLDKAEKYANKMNINLDEDEKNLSLALGGMKYGLSLKDLCDGYSTFANGGICKKSHFIEEITLKNGKTVYKTEDTANSIFSQGTCSLMNEMLIKTAREGTAKKLKDLPFDVAAKTGTCGNADGNTDAYCISYTSSDTVGVWLGDKENVPLQITGGGNATKIAKQILQKLYGNNSPSPLEINSGTTMVSIDRDEYKKNNKIILADDVAPILSVKEIKVLKGNEPKLKSSKFTRPTIEKPTIEVKNNTVFISLCQTEYYAYLIYKEKDGQKTTVYDGSYKSEISDTPGGGSTTYYVTPYFTNGGKKYFGKAIKLPAVNIEEKITMPQEEVPDIVHREWYNE